MRIQKYEIILFTVILFTLFNCNSVEPPINGKGITLKLEDVSCTEAWITLTTIDLQLPATVTLKQSAIGGSETTSTISLIKADTLLYIDSLLPNQSYNFQSFNQPINQSAIKSNVLSITTMDTTSHNFTWQTWTFGEHSSSVLRDVTIIDENNIWAVGEIYMNDSLGQPDPQAYGAAIWSGQSWELRKLFHNANIPITPKGIFVLSPNEIYLASGSIFRWDGTSSEVQMVFSRLNLADPNGTIEKLWGNSSSSIYGVGNAGSIVYYNGTGWNRIESGTNVNVNDVFGVTSRQNSQKKVFCAVSFVLQLGEHKILIINENNKVDSLSWNTGRRVNSVWSNNGGIVYTSGGGVFNNKSGNWLEETSIPLYYTNRIRGNGLNDVFVGGDFGLLAHFNGMNWIFYEEFLFATSSLSISVNKDILAAIGRQGAKSLIIIGKRN